ncbi:small ubiquitin-related modifier 3-like [Rhopalosiphum padi]|uniref:small ubiquitin-related modifier 3-like n=1 Tax=Rhopalosiphum padi TaxID=40932 RepID=UPI00298E0915|nr:small ubiquitin-related modifier 3-like [Rhopalosiphum padi]
MAEHKGDALEYINVKFLDMDDFIVQFKIKTDDSLIQLINHYCEINDLDKEEVRFRFYGQKIEEADTPSSLEMEEGDTIDVFKRQIG